MTAIVPREKLVAVLERLSSPYDGERAAAGLIATRMVRDAGTTWTALLHPSVMQRSSSSLLPWRSTISACKARSHRLTEWERRFIESIAEYQHRPSERQLAILSKIARRVLG